MPLILVIDDSSTVRQFVRSALVGHTVIDAGDGQAGLALFHRQNPDLVITDMVMPVKEGIETIREIRRSGRETKIVAMSGTSDKSERLYLAAAQKLGADAVLRKPFESTELQQVVDRLLASEDALAARSTKPGPGDSTLNGKEQRQFRRQELIWSGQALTADGSQIECAVLDLSGEGAKVILGQSLLVGTVLSFASPRFDPVKARVVWIDGRTAGLHFVDGINRVLTVLGGKYGEVSQAGQR
jgi:CheY-like chemotaxis protein